MGAGNGFMPGDGLFGFGWYAGFGDTMGAAGLFRFDIHSSKNDPVVPAGFGAVAGGIFCCMPPTFPNGLTGAPVGRVGAPQGDVGGAAGTAPAPNPPKPCAGVAGAVGFVSIRANISFSTSAFGWPYFAADSCLSAAASFTFGEPSGGKVDILKGCVGTPLISVRVIVL